MKNSISRIAIVSSFVLLSFNANFASNVNPSSSQVTETIVIDGKIYPLINLPAVEVNALGILKPVSSSNSDLNMKLVNSSKMVKVEKHNGVYLPSVLLAEASVVAYKKDNNSKKSFPIIFSAVYSFVYNHAAHFGVIQ